MKLNKHIPRCAILAVCSITSAITTVTSGSWTLVSDFSEFTEYEQRPETVDPEGNYVPTFRQNDQAPLFFDVLKEGEAGLDVVGDPDNPIFSFYLDSVGGLYDVRAAMALPLPEEVQPGQVVTLFMRVQRSGPETNHSFGFTGKSVRRDNPEAPHYMTQPDQWGDFTAQVPMGANFQMRDPIIGSPNVEPTPSVQAPINEWYEVYLVVDNGNFRSQLYYRDAAAIANGDAPTLITLDRGQAENDAGRENDWFYYRNYSPGLTADQFVGELVDPNDPASPYDGTLKAFYLSVGSNGTTDFTNIDDIYVDFTGVNLHSPLEAGTGEPPMESIFLSDLWHVGNDDFIYSFNTNWVYLGELPYVYTFGESATWWKLVEGGSEESGYYLYNYSDENWYMGWADNYTSSSPVWEPLN